MTVPTSAPGRRSLLKELTERSIRIPPTSADDSRPVSEYFGVDTFGARQMRDKLPKGVYEKLMSAIRAGKKLDKEIAPAVAEICSK